MAEILKTGIEQAQPQMVDIQKRAEDHQVPREIDTWLKKIEKDPGQQPVVNDTNGQPLLQLPATQDPKIKLPVTRVKFTDGFKKSLSDAGRWFSVFICRLIKINGGKVKFEDE